MHVGTKLIYTGENDSRYFTNRLEYEIIGDNGLFWYVTDNDGSASNGGKGHLWPKDDIHESFQPVPTGPVVTETVTKTRIVPGTYADGLVRVGEAEDDFVMVAVNHSEPLSPMTADELDAAAAVLSTLAKGLRDA